MGNGPFVVTLDLSLSDQLKTALVDQGFELSTPPNTLFAGRKKGVSCTLYASGKLVVQGKNKDEFIEFFLEPEILQDFSYSHPTATIDPTPRIGIDESGKGDVFGPLCIAGVYADMSMVERLIKVGVKDSKAMKDDAILKMEKKIREICPYHVIRLNPEKYNELYGKFKNLNRMLAWGHATAIEQLSKKTGCRTATIDQFAAEWVVESALKKKNLDIALTQRTKAEELTVVAAASILARAAFLQGMEMLSEGVGVSLPKGASSRVVDAGVQLIRTLGEQVLPRVCKMHFKTIQQMKERA